MESHAQPISPTVHAQLLCAVGSLIESEDRTTKVTIGSLF